MIIKKKEVEREKYCTASEICLKYTAAGRNVRHITKAWIQYNKHGRVIYQCPQATENKPPCSPK